MESGKLDRIEENVAKLEQDLATLSTAVTSLADAIVSLTDLKVEIKLLAQAITNDKGNCSDRYLSITRYTKEVADDVDKVAEKVRSIELIQQENLYMVTVVKFFIVTFVTLFSGIILYLID